MPGHLEKLWQEKSRQSISPRYDNIYYYVFIWYSTVQYVYKINYALTANGKATLLILRFQHHLKKFLLFSFAKVLSKVRETNFFSLNNSAIN